jgi:hypothetical protein
MLCYLECREKSEMWELFFQFDGSKFVQKILHRLDIRYLKLLTIMEEEGYGLSDSLYYVKHEGEGLNGLDLVDSNLKVDEMVRKYASTKKIVLTVMRDRRNRAIVRSPVKKNQAFHVDLDPDDEDVISHQFLSQDNSFCEGWSRQHYDHIVNAPVTQESMFCEKNKQAAEMAEGEEDEESGEEETDDELAAWMHISQFDPVAADRKRREEKAEFATDNCKDEEEKG